jgi:hypothetical protein
MSKSKKKQTARKRATEQPPEEVAMDLPAPKELPLNQALHDRIVAAATRAGQMREEGERMSWVYNGDAVALKYTEGDEAQPARILVAAFRQGVVFQVEGDRQVVYQPGAWEQELDRLEPAPDDEEDVEAGLDEHDEDDEDEA